MNQRLPAEKLAKLAAAAGSAGELLRAFDLFVRTAGDDALVRINPVQFAQQRGFATGAVVEMFLLARKPGFLWLTSGPALVVGGTPAQCKRRGQSQVSKS